MGVISEVFERDLPLRADVKEVLMANDAITASRFDLVPQGEGKIPFFDA